MNIVYFTLIYLYLVFVLGAYILFLFYKANKKFAGYDDKAIWIEAIKQSAKITLNSLLFIIIIALFFSLLSK